MIDLHIIGAGELPEIFDKLEGVIEIAPDSNIDYTNYAPHPTKDKGYFFVTDRHGNKCRVDFEYHEPFTL